MKKKRFLFVSWTSRGFKPFFDPSVRYRCFHLAMELTKRGHQADVISQQDLERKSDLLGEYDSYIFHRPKMNEFFADFIYDVKDRAIADFDDMIFDVAFADLTPMVRVRGSPYETVRHYVACTQEAARQFHRFTVSTKPLAEHCRKLFGGDVAVFHNAMDEAYIDLADLYRKSLLRSRRIYDFGYFSGTATHDLDFKLLGASLANYLEVNIRARMLLVGPLHLPSELEPYRSRIDIMSLVPFYQLPSLKAQCRKILAPLEDNFFTRCKSGLKFFEAAVLGCDVLATPIPDIDRFESPLLRKCSEVSDWDIALSASDIPDGVREDAIAEVKQVSRSANQVDAWLEYAS